MLAAGVKRAAGIKGDLGHFGATNFLVGLLTILRDSGFPGLVIHGHPARRLPNTASVSFPRLDAGRLLAVLADAVAVSGPAACHGDQVRASHVLQAMGVPVEVAMGTLRLSVGRFTGDHDDSPGQ